MSDQAIPKPTCGRVVHFVMGDGQLRPAIVTRDPEESDASPVDGKCRLQLKVFIDETADRQHGKHEGEHSGRPALVYIDAGGFAQKVVDANGFAAQTPYHGTPDARGKYPPKTWHWMPFQLGQAQYQLDQAKKRG